MAVTISVAALAEAVGTDSDMATRLLAVASELVNRHAPDAPVAIQNESAIRTAGVFDLSQRQRVTDIHYDREADDLGRTVEVAERI